jgi:hypothetical protein
MTDCVSITLITIGGLVVREEAGSQDLYCSIDFTGSILLPQ